MAVWKKILVTGSNVSELINDSGYAITGSNRFIGSQFITGSLSVTGSSGTPAFFIVKGNTQITGTFSVNSNNYNQTQPAMQVNSEGVFGIGSYSTTPSPIEGGLIYSGSEYYFGYLVS